MAEFDINEFTELLRDYLYGLFPRESDKAKETKHSTRPLHIRDIAFGNLPTRDEDGAKVFEIGSEYAEEKYPYYHILEDAEVIRKRGKGNKQSGGGQAKIEKLGKRDYGRWSFNGKTYSQEYRKNVRGERSRVGKATEKWVGLNGQIMVVNKDASYYKNVHYHYIEKILDYSIPFIAQWFDMKIVRKQLTSGKEEYEQQELESLIEQLGMGAEDYD